VNQVLHAGAEQAQYGWLMGVTTLVFLSTMVGWAAWAWWPSRRAEMEAASLLPLGDES